MSSQSEELEAAINLMIPEELRDQIIWTWQCNECGERGQEHEVRENSDAECAGHMTQHGVYL